MRRFTVLRGGYLVSMMGSTLTGVALGSSFYLHTGSIAQFAIGFPLSVLPGIATSHCACFIRRRWT
jgi:hypothetical protein